MKTQSAAVDSAGAADAGVNQATAGAAAELADVLGDIGDLPEDVEDPTGGVQTSDGATDADVLALMNGEVQEDAVATEQAQAQPAAKPQAPKAPPAPPPVEQVLQQQQQVTQELAGSLRQLTESLPQMIAFSQQQMMGNLMQMANQRASEAKMQAERAAAAPQEPGPDATVEDVLRYEVQKARYDATQKLTAQDQEVMSLRQRLDQFENGITRARNTEQIHRSMATVSADPNYAWTKHPVGQEMVLSACHSLLQSGAAKSFDQNLVNHVSHQIANFMEEYSVMRERMRSSRGAQGAAQNARTQQQAAAPRQPAVRGGNSTPAAGGQTNRVDKIARELGLAGGKRLLRVR